MDSKHFDKLATAVGRRTILGGALAGILGLGTATLADAAKGNKAKKTAAKKRKNNQARNEAVCTGVGTDPAAGQCPIGTCCVATPPGNNVGCVPLGQQNAQFCGGSDTTTAPCRVCPTGTRCQAAPAALIGPPPLLPAGSRVCACDPTTCANGCCTPPNAAGDQQCIPNGSGAPVNATTTNPAGPIPSIPNGAFVCGVGGGICNVCSTTTALGLTLPFSGCCTAQGQCNAGTAGSNCGTNGTTCAVCTANQTCGLNQQCSNNFAPPVPPAPPAPPPAATCPGGGPGGNPSIRVCGGQCVNTLDNNENCGQCAFRCGRKSRCTSGQCRRVRRRRRRN